MKEFVAVIRCKYCEFYLPWGKVKDNPDYPEFERTENLLGHDGFCDNCDKWIDENDFCSSAKEKEK